MRDRSFTPTPLLTICALSILLCLSCKFLKPGEPIEFTTVEDCSALRYPSRANFVFQDSTALRAFWFKYCHDTIVVPVRVPRVDFNTSTLICVFMGACPSPAFSTSIEETRIFEDEIVVYIREDYRSGVWIALGTYPSHLVTIPKTTLPIEFEYREKRKIGDVGSERAIRKSTTVWKP